MSGSIPRPIEHGPFRPEVGAEPFPGYRLLQLRGRGAFATVWESSTPWGAKIALKFMSTQNGNIAAREIRSLQAIQALDHPNLFPIQQVWSLPGFIVIAMELADASLLDLMMLYLEDFGRSIDPAKLGYYMNHVAKALDYLNARRHSVEGRTVGYQHGDIKPSNILLLGDIAKLADYGLAIPTLGSTTPCPRAGTLDYAAPEVFQGYVTETSDQFSLAVTYHLLRTAAHPFPTPPDSAKVSMKGYQRPAPDLHRLPPLEQTIVARALSPIPQNRFPNCATFVRSLLDVQNLMLMKAEDGTQVVPVANTITPVKRPSRH